MKTRLLFCFALLIPTCADAQTLGSCRIFPSDNPWNVRVDSLPVHWNSDAYVASVGGSINVHPDFGSDTNYGIPWIAVNGSQPFVAINTSNGYQDQSDPGPMPIPPNAPIEGHGVGDAHVLVVDTSNHYLYELYQGVKDQNDNGWAATSSAIFALDSNNYRPDGWTSCDAAGLPIFPGLVRLDECKAGVINHALRFTVPHTQKAWIFPARHEAGSTSDTTFMPMGLRMRLKASYDDSHDTGYAKVIITALKKYGIILADNGSAWYISGETNPNWPDDDLSQLKKIPGSEFEAVYTYPTATDSGEYPTPVIPIPSGTSGTAGILHVTSDPFSLGNVELGQADTMTIAMSNTGNGPLIITGVFPLGSNDFSILSIPPSLKQFPDTLQPGTVDTAQIRFAPTKLGGDTAILVIGIYESASLIEDTSIYFVGLGFSNAGVASAPAQAFGFTVFPNPSAGQSTISFTGAAGPIQIEITDAIGRSVLKQTILSASGTLDLGTLANGCYFLHAQSAQGSVSKMIEVLH